MLGRIKQTPVRCQQCLGCCRIGLQVESQRQHVGAVTHQVATTGNRLARKRNADDQVGLTRQLGEQTCKSMQQHAVQSYAAATRLPVPRASWRSRSPKGWESPVCSPLSCSRPRTVPSW